MVFPEKGRVSAENVMVGNLTLDSVHWGKALLLLYSILDVSASF